MNTTTTHRDGPSARPSASFTNHVAEELLRYDEHLCNVRGLAARSRQNNLRIVGWLLQQKFAECPVEIAKLRPEDVRRFLASQLDAHRTTSNASHLASSLRSYFRYRTTCGDRVDALTAVISSPVNWRLATIPRALKPDEVERLLNYFTANLRLPKRDYAIVRCALDM